MKKLKLTSEQKLRSLARKQFYDENYLGALKTYQQIIDICPYDAKSIYQLMTNYVSMGIFPQTTSEYSFDEEGKLKDDEKWIDIDLSDLEREDEAESLILKEAYQLETSISTIHETLVKTPTDFGARLALAVCYEYWSDYPEAIEIYKVLASPENVKELRLSALKRLVQCYKEIENDKIIEKTIKQVEELSEEKDSEPEMNYERALLANRSRDFIKAQEQLQLYEEHPNLTFSDDIEMREIENKILFAKYDIFMESQYSDKASNLIRSFVDKIMIRKKLYRTDLNILHRIGAALEFLKDLDYLKLLAKRQEIMHKPDLYLKILHNIGVVSKATGNHVERFDALFKMKQNIYTLVGGDYADVWKRQLNAKSSVLYDTDPKTSDLSINEYVESNLSDVKIQLKNSNDKRVQQINNDLTELEAKIQAENEEDENNMIISLTSYDEKVIFQCKVVGRENPNTEDGDHDHSWLQLNVKVVRDKDTFNRTEPVIQDYELVDLYRWFESLSKNQLPESGILAFIEHCISFRFVHRINGIITICINLEAELEPDFKMDSDSNEKYDPEWQILFDLTEHDFTDILRALKLTTKRYGYGSII